MCVYESSELPSAIDPVRCKKKKDKTVTSWVKIKATHGTALSRMRMVRMWMRWSSLRFKAPWPVYIRLQLVFVPLRPRFWLILAFQLQLYTKRSSIGQQTILDREAMPDTLIGHSIASSSLSAIGRGRSGSIFTPDKTFNASWNPSFCQHHWYFLQMLLCGLLCKPKLELIRNRSEDNELELRFSKLVIISKFVRPRDFVIEK